MARFNCAETTQLSSPVFDRCTVFQAVAWPWDPIFFVGTRILVHAWYERLFSLSTTHTQIMTALLMLCGSTMHGDCIQSWVSWGRFRYVTSTILSNLQYLPKCLLVTVSPSAGLCFGTCQCSHADQLHHCQILVCCHILACDQSPLPEYPCKLLSL